MLLYNTRLSIFGFLCIVARINSIPVEFSFLYSHGILSRFTGWQFGIQECAADWDEDWDKLEEEGEITEEEWLYMFNLFFLFSLYFWFLGHVFQNREWIL